MYMKDTFVHILLENIAMNRGIEALWWATNDTAICCSMRMEQHMEGAPRRSLGSQAQHTHSLEDHTWSIQQSTTTHTKHIHNIQQQNSNYTHTHCELFHQTIHKHCQHTQQTDTLIEQHTTNKDTSNKDTTLHSLLLRSKRL